MHMQLGTDGVGAQGARVSRFVLITARAGPDSRA